MNPLKRWARQALGAAGYAVFNSRAPGVYARDGLYTWNRWAFREDPEFQSAYRRGVRAGQGVDPRIEWRVHVALWAARMALEADGDFIECGVNAGFTSSAIMQRLGWGGTGRTFFLVDTFNGPVLTQYSEEETRSGQKRAAEDAIARGAYVTDLERVRENFAEWSNVRIVPGAVPEILEQVDAREVAFLHIDMNCAAPEVAAFEYFWERLSPGGVVLFDDYARYSYDELARALDVAVRRRGAETLALPTGQGLIRKGSRPPSR
jgi:hypothetical protein